MELFRHQGWMHLAAFLTTLLLAAGIVGTGLVDQWVFPAPQSFEIYHPLPKQEGRIGIWTDPQLELNFRQGLAQSIVLIGSSELSENKLVEIPYRFFPEQLNYPVFALGQGGHQCHNIFSTLAAYSEHLSNARLVIVLSVGWFEGVPSEGTSTDMFLKYHNERTLSYIEHNPAFPDSLRQHTDAFIGQHFNEIGKPGPLLRKAYYRYQQSRSPLHRAVFAPFSATYSVLADWQFDRRKTQYEQKQIGLDNDPATAAALTKKTTPFPTPASPNWEALLNEGVEKAKAASQSNDLGVNDVYYQSYLANNPRRKVKPVPVKACQEFQDLQHLLSLLKHHNTEALFVMQSLHPGVYNRLDEMDDPVALIQQTVEESGFSFLNLHTSNPEEYRVGTLTDIMHSGPYGWMRINQEMYSTFFSK